jgi:hypothetical protein
MLCMRGLHFEFTGEATAEEELKSVLATIEVERHGRK